MNTYLQDYLSYLRIEKNCSPITVSDYRLELTKFLSYPDISIAQSLDDIYTSLIRKYIQDAKETRNLCSASTAKVIAILKSYFNYISDDARIKNNPTKKIKLPRKEKPLPKVLSELDFEKLISCVRYSPSRCQKNSIRDRLILSILYYCGLRRSELISLNWEDLDLGKKMLFIRRSKNKSGRIIPIHPKVSQLLDMYLEQRLPLQDPALFIGEMGKRLTYCAFSDLIRMYFKISGLTRSGYSAHSLRHSFATRLIEKNVNISMVQRLMGHTNLDSTKIYIHFDDQGFRRAIESI